MTTPTHALPIPDDPGDLIAGVPSLLTFHPADSVVLVTYTGLRRLHLESVLRMDIPEPEHLAEVARQLRVAARNHEAAVVDLIVLGGAGADPPEHLPQRSLVECIIDELDAEDIELSHAVWAPRVEAGLTWWCYEDPTCTGQIREPGTSAITATLAMSGTAVFASREELAAHLAPDPDDALARRAELLATHPPADTAEEFQFLKDTLDAITRRIHTDPHHPLPELDDATVVRLASALSISDIREACLAFTMTIRARAAELLWTALTRAVPGSARADPASLLGVSCYLKGDGARATLALDAALAANHNHRLTQVLRQVVDYGLPPRQFRTLLAQSFVASFANR